MFLWFSGTGKKYKKLLRLEIWSKRGSQNWKFLKSQANWMDVRLWTFQTHPNHLLWSLIWFVITRWTLRSIYNYFWCLRESYFSISYGEIRRGHGGSENQIPEHIVSQNVSKCVLMHQLSVTIAFVRVRDSMSVVYCSKMRLSGFLHIIWRN